MADLTRILLIHPMSTSTLNVETALIDASCILIGAAPPKGHEALKLARSQDPEIAVLYLNSENQSSVLALADKIQRICPIPVIFITESFDLIPARPFNRKLPRYALLDPIKQQELNSTIQLALKLKQQENLLHREIELHRIFFESTSDAIIVLDNELRIIEANSVALQLLQSTPERVLGNYFKDITIFHDPETNNPMGNTGSFLTACTLSSFNHTSRPNVLHLNKDGKKSYYKVRAQDWHNSPEEKIGTVLFFQNITEHLDLERNIHHAEKIDAISQLASGVAHDFNNLLGIITFYTELLQRTVPANSRRARYLERVQNAAEMGTRLVKDFSAISRHDSPKQIKCFDLVSTVSETESLVRRVLGKMVILKCNFPGNSIMIHGDPVMLKQAIINLCVNARDAMNEVGDITITVENTTIPKSSSVIGSIPAGHYASLKVADTGSGIPPATLKKIWEPFYTTKAEGKGTGLGLSNVKNTIRHCNGFIDVESAPGVGTTFTLLFPIRRDLTIPPPNSSPAN